MYYSYKLTSFGNYISAFNLKNGQYSLELGIPGFKKEDISVSTEDNIYIIIEGKNEKYGEFERTYVLPEDSDVEKVEANVKNGVLSITVPQTQKRKNKIDVK